MPQPFGPAAALADQLGLGTREAALEMLWQPLRPEWHSAVGIAQRPANLLWPVEGGRFGRGLSDGPVPHRGIDLGAPRGAPIRAVADGLVGLSDNTIHGYGNAVLVLHGGHWVSVYAHCEKTLVFAGQRVRRGQEIATVGETGLARGVHLHFELRIRGEPRDPSFFFVGEPWEEWSN